MSNLKSLLVPQVAIPTETIYLSKGNTPPEKNLVYSRGTASIVGSGKNLMRLYFGHQSQSGMVNIREIRPETIYGMPHVNFDIGIMFNPINHVPNFFRLIKPKPILSDEILIVPLRELSYKDAKNEITKYIQHAAGRKVYISELAEELRLDIELIMEVMEELETKT